MDCSIVVPVYKGEATLQELVERLNKVRDELGENCELILVNDGSPDDSSEISQNLSQCHPWVRTIRLMRNYGQHNATLCGIRAARYGVIVTMDDDLQHPPEEIPVLLAKLAEGYDVVYGTPQKVSQNLWRTLASKMIRLMLRNVMGSDVAWKTSSFRAFRTSIREAFATYANHSVFVDVLLTWGASSFAAVPVRQDTRKVGSSTYTVGKLFSLAMTMLTGFSTLPLRVATMIGFFFTFFGMGVLVYVMVRYLIVGGSIPGFPFLSSIIAIFSGATLFALGIMGEYLGRIYTHSMGQPAYIIDKE